MSFREKILCIKETHEKRKLARKVYKKTPTGRKKHAENCTRSYARKLGHHPVQGQVPPKTDRCECCGRPPGKKGLHLDHDHTKELNNFRAWLCGNCNLAMGLLGDTLEGIKNAEEFWRRRYGELGQ